MLCDLKIFKKVFQKDKKYLFFILLEQWLELRIEQRKQKLYPLRYSVPYIILM
jgi:hypothetical protein